MENSKKNNDFYTGEPQVLRKAEIARILNTVKQAPFNADNSNNSNDKAFKNIKGNVFAGICMAMRRDINGYLRYARKK